jgi:tRNA A-37 threonylcarbamoyl transferase component Bud32
LQSLYDAICDVAPLAEVAYVGNRLQVDRVSQASSIVAYGVEDTCTYPERFKDAAVVAFIVEDEEEYVQKMIEILRNKKGSRAGMANVFLVGQPLNIDYGKLTAKISSIMEVGADDVVVVPSDSSQLKRVISVSLAKAKTCKDQTDRLRRKLAASRTQCQHLFWDVAHEVLDGMPQLREGLHEAHEKSVGNIQFIRRAGTGSSSDVYLCRNASKEKTCVAKVFNKQEIKSIDMLCEIVLEHDILRKLKHPNIIEAINLVHGPQNMYLFTEWVGASNLFQTINSASEQGLFWTQAKDLMLDIFAAAAYMHDMKVAHCDLKPENIVVSSEGNAKLIDFGEAVAVDKDIPGLKNPKGTFPFMAREIMLCSKTWDPIAADLWALGVIQIEMCCGNHSFTQILGWKHSLTSLLEIQNCADELLIAFENQSKEALLDRVVERCRSELPRFARAFLSGLLEICPENRLAAKTVLAILEDNR